MASNVSKKIGEILVEKGLIKEDDITWAQDIQKKTGERLGTVLARYNFVSESDIARALSEQIGWSYIEVTPEMVDTETLGKIGVNFCLQNSIVPVYLDGSQKPAFALIDPYDTDLTDKIIQQFGQSTMFITTQTALETSIHGQAIIPKGSMDGAIKKMEDGISAGEAREFLDMLLRKAMELEATDIHIEPSEKWSSEIRMRIDGILRPISAMKKDRHDAIANILFPMAKGNPGVFTIPFEGQIDYQIDRKSISLRLSSIPTVCGPSIVLRIHDKNRAVMPLEFLGYSSEHLNLIKDIISSPYGLFLVVGPTGSGKTTTFYSIITGKKSTMLKIVTVEDPVEITLSLIQQVQLNPKAGIDYAPTVKAFLRQDPDIMLIGEIRDRETAMAAAEAAMTGHLVLSTLHTNSAIESLLRLKDLGLSNVILSEILLGVVSQRLVRKRCQVCNAKGCKACRQTGYSGRTVIAEVLRCTPRIKEMIEQESSIKDIEKQAISEGFIPMKEDALRLIESGVTTKEEVLRVTGEEYAL